MRIYVGGLPYSMTGDSLHRLFSEHGEVSDATVVNDKFSGQSKGFGFVEMPDADQARAAISRLNGTAQGGRNLTVNEARPREERSGGGGGYGGGGGRRW